MAKIKRSGATPAIRALTASGIAFTPVEYSHRDGNHDFGAEAARETGIDPDHIYKTLVVSLGFNQLAVGVVPVSGRLDFRRLAAALGAKRAELAAPKAAERSSGYVLGGVSPLGQRTLLPTVIDVSALSRDIMYVSGGRRGLQLGLSPGDLAEATGAMFAAIAV